jgi:hypothetical protein
MAATEVIWLPFRTQPVGTARSNASLRLSRLVDHITPSTCNRPFEAAKELNLDSECFDERLALFEEEVLVSMGISVARLRMIRGARRPAVRGALYQMACDALSMDVKRAFYVYRIKSAIQERITGDQEAL